MNGAGAESCNGSDDESEEEDEGLSEEVWEEGELIGEFGGCDGKIGCRPPNGVNKGGPA